VLFCCDGDDVTCGDVPSLGSIDGYLERSNMQTIMCVTPHVKVTV